MSGESSSLPAVVTYEQVERNLKVEDDFKYRCWREQLRPILVGDLLAFYCWARLTRSREPHAKSFDTSPGIGREIFPGLNSTIPSYVNRHDMGSKC